MSIIPRKHFLLRALRTWLTPPFCYREVGVVLSSCDLVLANYRLLLRLKAFMPAVPAACKCTMASSSIQPK